MVGGCPIASMARGYKTRELRSGLSAQALVRVLRLKEQQSVELVGGSAKFQGLHRHCLLCAMKFRKPVPVCFMQMERFCTILSRFARGESFTQSLRPTTIPSPPSLVLPSTVVGNILLCLATPRRVAENQTSQSNGEGSADGPRVYSSLLD